jgi:hypothetical protein
VVIETRPSTTRISGNASANLLKNLSLLCTVDYTQDDAMDEIRVLAGVSVRLR